MIPLCRCDRRGQGRGRGWYGGETHQPQQKQSAETGREETGYFSTLTKPYASKGT